MQQHAFHDVSEFPVGLQRILLQLVVAHGLACHASSKTSPSEQNVSMQTFTAAAFAESVGAHIIHNMQSATDGSCSGTGWSC